MRVLLVDDQPVFRDPVAMGLESMGFDVMCADSATQALDHLARFLPQVVVVDLSMPAINGLEFVKYLRSRGHYRLIPVIMLTAHSDQRFIIEAAKLGIRDYLLKSSFSLLDLVQRIRNYEGGMGQGHSSLHGIPGSSVPGDPSSGVPNQAVAPPFELPRIPLQTLLDGVALRALKPQAARMIGMCASPEIGLMELEGELKQDPMLAARVLQTANTTTYRRGSPVNKLGEAISLLGLTNLRNVVASTVIEDGLLTDLVEEDAWRSWQNSLALARAMGEIDDPKVGPFPGSGYILGLCANLPQMLLTQFWGDRYRPIRDWAEANKQSPAKVLETIFSHPLDEIYQGILLKIGLPPKIAEPVVEFTQATMGAGIELLSRTARVMDAANQWCRAMGFCMVPFQTIRAVTRDELRDTPSLGKIPFRLGEIRTEVMSLSYEYTRESKPLRKILEKPFFAMRDDIRLALHCDPWVVADGPVHQLLGSLCQSETVDLQFFDDPKWTGLVVVTDNPKGMFPMGLPTKAPLLILHRVALKKEDLPSGARVGALRLPCAMADIARAVQSI
jgi:CheY-like chemotaxis protein